MKPSLFCLIALVLASSCSEDSPSPQAPPSKIVLTEIEKVICGSTSKTWNFVAVNRSGKNEIRACAVNDHWIFRYSRLLEIKNTGLSCDGQDAFQEHDWAISSDEKKILIGGSSFRIVKMESAEMHLMEEVQGDPVFVFKR
ncbi:MAG TPA: hypothetical protein VGD40_13370 [Chryseosolibacter sp.]